MKGRAPPHQRMPLPQDIRAVLEKATVTYASTTDELADLSVKDAVHGWHDVAYDIPGGRFVAARVCRVRNGISANYTDPYMRRRDPDCLVIADERATDKQRFSERFGGSFDALRGDTLSWLESQELAVFGFHAGTKNVKGVPALAICPANAGFFALGLALLQGIEPVEHLDENFAPRAFILVAPPFRQTHFGGKQIVVHERTTKNHYLFSYNLYPGPSAKKGVYGMLLEIGEREGWVAAHCSAVTVVTPYDNHVTIMHEGASGGGKSEMLEHVHREADGRLLLGENTSTGEKMHLVLPRACNLRPVCDDMALCLNPSRNGRKLRLTDAESAWFIRVDHIEHYGVDPQLERLTIDPPEPLLFLNLDAVPDGRALIWEPVMDAPGQRCPNPRVVMPRRIVPGIIDGIVTVDIRSFGVRAPPCTKDRPTYGILGMMSVLPPALAWLWRLTAPRGHSSPSIVATAEAIPSEGVGSFEPFLTGRRVEQANLLLRQILDTPDSLHVLIPNQHIGAWRVGFMPQWICREYLARRGATRFRQEQLVPSRCPLLGQSLTSLQVEGSNISPSLLQVERQEHVGLASYDEGAAQLQRFFDKNLRTYLDRDLDPLGREIIECCLKGGRLEDYQALSTAGGRKRRAARRTRRPPPVAERTPSH